MIQRIINVTLLVAVLVSVTINIYLLVNTPNFAYVRSHDLIEQYKGTLEARSKFQKKKGVMQANLDSLKLDFERAGGNYMSQAPMMTPAQRTEHEKILRQRQDQLVQYSDAIDQKIQEEDTKMMQEVLNQVNSFVEDYAKREGYDLILGTTLSGSLLYGEKSIDITDKIVEELNKQYKGQ